MTVIELVTMRCPYHVLSMAFMLVLDEKDLPGLGYLFADILRLRENVEASFLRKAYIIWLGAKRWEKHSIFQSSA